MASIGDPPYSVIMSWLVPSRHPVITSNDLLRPLLVIRSQFAGAAGRVQPRKLEVYRELYPPVNGRRLTIK